LIHADGLRNKEAKETARSSNEPDLCVSGHEVPIMWRASLPRAFATLNPLRQEAGLLATAAITAYN
jgi:hypothetical protein